ncbi:DUF2357 domain-containing protein [Clostridium sp. AL.422]|uniref:DUF2357 domain-containing protein n=1 Tax=Clostridium TaxID=1485 RepID=UPI00293DE704|nr:MULTISPECIES: DUF2357 domain-containing protein [unclassified Clostridium]MDV4151762.1 DUF2357 domain-containing protein [Clostridium sp. AL.422]
MDSQASGNREIIFIESDNVCFIIKSSSDVINYNNEAEVKIDSYGNIINTEFNKNVHLKEYSNYEVIVESKNGADVEFYHENINIRNKVTQTRRGSKNLSGIINFKGDIGFSDIIIKVNGRKEFKCTLEVYPSKICYKEDYQEILRDVSEEIYNLSYGFLARTYLGAEINNKVSSSNTEFYSILNYVFDKLIKAIDIIIMNPHHQLYKENRVCNYQSLKNVSNDTVKWLEKRPQSIRKVNGRYIPTEALQTKKIITTNTKENRFIKFILIKIINKIDNFIKCYKNINTSLDSVVIERLNLFKRKISTKINTSLLRDIKEEFNEASMSLVLTIASGYRDIFKYYLMLQKGLTINSNIFSLSMKDLSLLYEYWCFIKINSLLKKKYNLISTDLININRDGIYVSLKKGITSNLLYENPNTGEKFKVSYNSIMTSKTVAQKPDNVLSINKDNCEKSYEFIFDAKYKIDTTDEYIGKYGEVGPKEEDINTMHRYRDSILYRNKIDYKNENCIFGAFVLFPYKNEEEFREHKFYKSIEEVNIGAIPFLPSTTTLMTEFLDELINESSYSTFERSIKTIGEENYINEDQYAKRNVLVGSLKNKEQLDINLKYNFYHTKKKNINIIDNKIEYIAIAQSINHFGTKEAGIKYYGKVKEIKELKRNDITEIPDNSEELYYKFIVDEWLRLNNKIKVKGNNVMKIIYTTEYLLRSADTVSELFIKDKEELRIWRELKRIFKEIEVENYHKENKQVIKFLKLENKQLIIEENIIKIIDGKSIETIDKNDFNKNPKRHIKAILN